MGQTKHIAAIALVAGIVGLVPTAAAAQQQPTTTTSTSSTTQPGQPGQPTGGGESLQGTLRYRQDDEQVPAEGIALTVDSADGTFHQEITTDEDGRYSVELPGPGDYVVELDTKTLPEGVDLRDGGNNVRRLNIPPGESRTVLFRISSGGEGGGNKEFDRFLRLSVQGIRFGLILAMCAIGLSLIFGTTGMVNFAHGELVTFGALMAYYYNQTRGWPFLLSVGLAIATTGLLGGVLNRVLWRPLRNRGTGLVALIVFTIGLGVALRYLFVYQFGGAPRNYTDYSRQLDAYEFGPISIVPRDLWIIGLSIVILVTVGLFLQRTRMGKAMRAVADDPELAESTGVNVERVISWVWISGAGLAGIGGIFQALSQGVRWDTGFQLLLLIFASVILGGIGTAYGALVGALVMGLFIQLSTMVVDTEFKTATALLVMIVVLMIRPQGILGQAERVG